MASRLEKKFFCNCCGRKISHKGNCYACNIRNKRARTSTVRYPSHTELYKHIHVIEEDIIKDIFRGYNWTFENDKHKQVTDYHVMLEENGWDIIFCVTSCPDKSVQEWINTSPARIFYIEVEYKSSLFEWGKQIDEFFRQIKRRPTYGKPVILSFDPRFLEYQQAAVRAGTDTVVLPHNILEKMKG